MAKRILSLLILTAMLLTLAACEKTRIVHCDRCGAEIVLKADDSNVDEDWILLCGDCEEELYGDDPLISPGD